jgi:TonB family protein
MDRLQSDAGFHDEISSLVRTIIYQERDGLSWAELMELLAAAVGGPGLDDVTAPEVREAVHRMMAFVESVFRTRRNPGVESASPAVQVASPEPEVAAVPVVEQAAVKDDAKDAPVEPPSTAEPAEPPKMDMFYRAQKVAEEQKFEAVVEQRKAENVEKLKLEDDATESDAAFHPNLKLHVPFEDFEDRETAERGSPAWLWVAGMCALLLAFCAGLFVHQRLMEPLRAPNTPYETPPPLAQQGRSAVPPAPATSSAGQPAATAKNPAATTSTPAVKPAAGNVPADDLNQRPRYMAPATIGASSEVMAARLLSAPPPAYPMMAEMTRIQGKVMVEAVVGKSGRVIRAQAISGHRLLRGAAVRAVYARRYRPYMVNDRPVNVATVVTVDFKLKK